MSPTTFIHPCRTVPFRKPALSPAAEKARKALIEATNIVDESTIGKFLLRQDSPEGFATLVASTQREILYGDCEK